MTLEEEILSLIKQRMIAEGKTRLELARYMGKSASSITKLFSRIDKESQDGDEGVSKEQRALKIEDLDLMLRFLGLRFSHDILVASRKVYVKFAPLRGAVAHGIWRERDMSSAQSQAKTIEIPTLPVAEFADLEQYALEVADAHGEKYVSQNGYILCVPFSQARKALKVDDIVVIERTVEMPAAKRNVVLVERALRKVAASANGFVLMSLSENASVDDIPHDPTDTRVKITDLVIGSFVLPPNISL